MSLFNFFVGLKDHLFQFINARPVIAQFFFESLVLAIDISTGNFDLPCLLTSGANLLGKFARFHPHCSHVLLGRFDFFGKRLDLRP